MTCTTRAPKKATNAIASREPGEGQKDVHNGHDRRINDAA